MTNEPSDSSEPTDESLMARYIAGDAEAFRLLFERYHPILLRLMQRRGARPAEASDYVQQTFLQLHRARNDFRSDARLRPYLMTIALNVHRGAHRRRARHPEEAVHLGEPTEPADDREQLDPIEQREDADRLRAALSALPPKQREVIEMHWFDELAFREISEMVGASLSAVKVRAFRGYAKLRKLLEPTVTP